MRWILIVTLAAATHGAAQVEIVGDIPGTFIDIALTGTDTGLGDEDVAEILPGFDLTRTLFAGDGSGRAWVGNNGAIGFLDDGAFGVFFENQTIPHWALFGHGEKQALVPYWDDLDATTGAVYYETVGDPGERILIIQWQDRPHFIGDDVLDGDEITFQVQIFESASPGHAQFLYLDTDFMNPDFDDGASATIGFQGGRAALGANDVMWSYNQPGAVGSGTVLTLVGTPCPPDFNGDGVLDSRDFVAFLNAFTDGDDSADYNADGDVNSQDFVAFLNDFVTGC